MVPFSMVKVPLALYTPPPPWVPSSLKGTTVLSLMVPFFMVNVPRLSTPPPPWSALYS